VTPLDRVQLVLASTSRYRAELLARIAPRFAQVSPAVEETPQSGETAATLAARLAHAKAAAVADRHVDSIVIGCDQAAELGGAILGKPGDAGAACDQLHRASGQSVVFHTAICLFDTRSLPSRVISAADATRVRFRQLDDVEIEAYVARERPLDCAGSFKAEGLGIALFDSIESTDPTALIGLPLILLCRLLRQAGIAVI
jgi:septum formation protein